MPQHSCNSSEIRVTNSDAEELKRFYSRDLYMCSLHVRRALVSSAPFTLCSAGALESLNPKQP